MKRKEATGLKLWHGRVRDVYASLEELRAYNRVYGTVRRCGYRSAKALWRDNPVLQGSTNPEDFGVAQ